MLKKRHIAGIACLAASLMMLLAACGSSGSDSSSFASAQPPAASGSTSSETPSASPTEDAAFTPGTWLSDGGQYYFFDEGGATGRTAGLEDGTGVGFTYSIAGTEAVFSMGAADNTNSCTVSRNGDTVTLEWADGATEHLTYVSEQGSDTFQFYSNQELADLALRFYQENNSAQDNQNLTSAAQTNEDGSVTIQLAFRSIYNVYNILAAYAACRECGVAADTAAGVINNYILKNGRMQKFTLGEHRGMLLTSKHENSIAYDTNLRYIRAAQEPCTVLVIVDAVSRKYFTSETSWLWDIDFDQLNAPQVQRIILSGRYCNDLAERFSFTDIPREKVTVQADIPAAAAELKADGSENVYVVTCFSDRDKILSQVVKEA